MRSGEVEVGFFRRRDLHLSPDIADGSDEFIDCCELCFDGWIDVINGQNSGIVSGDTSAGSKSCDSIFSIGVGRGMGLEAGELSEEQVD